MSITWAHSADDAHRARIPASYLEELNAAVELRDDVRWLLAQLVALAGYAPTLTAQQLRDRLHALADRVRPDG